MSPTVAVVADGGPSAGLGHVARCSAVAAALRARAIDIVCVAYGASEPLSVDSILWSPGDDVPEADAALLDTYTMPMAERAALAERMPLAVVHDEGELPAGARLAIAMEDVPDVETLSGLRHAPLRPPYWGVPARAVRPSVSRILVTTGGGALRGAGVGAAAALKAAYPEAIVALVRGPYASFDAPAGTELVDAPASLLAEFLAADVVVSAAGQSALEAACTGAATVAVPLAPNQWPNARALSACGAAVVAKPGAEVDAVSALDRESLAHAAQRAVDGFGALRIAYRVAALT